MSNSENLDKYVEPISSSQARIQVYTGDGKGKTTAAIGLAVRAAGAGGRVAIVQFDKGYDPARGEHYHERVLLRTLPQIELYPFGCERMMPDGTFRFKNQPEDFEQARAALARCRELLESRRCFLLVCDEILTSIRTKLVSEADVLDLIELQKREGAVTELALTGRRASDAVIQRADLVTEMRPLKHYFEQGLAARKGIEY